MGQTGPVIKNLLIVHTAAPEEGSANMTAAGNPFSAP